MTKKDYLIFDYSKFNIEKFKNILLEITGKDSCKILFVSTYQINHIRKETILGIMKNCHAEIKVILTGNSRCKYIKALKEIIKYQNDFDVIFLAFRGQELLPFVKLIAKIPIIFDAFVSVYDTLCFDRELFKPESIIGKLCKEYDKFVCNISQKVLVDTQAHQKYFVDEFGANNVEYIYVESDKTLFKPSEVKPDNINYKVLWYGSANPLQGVDVILHAAKLLESKNIVFQIIGPVRKRYHKLIKDLKLSNTEFIDFIPYENLPEIINNANLCLGGHFSKKDKACRVIPCKIYQFLDCGKPTVAGDNPANRELFFEGSLVYFVKQNDPSALAKTIMEIQQSGK